MADIIVQFRLEDNAKYVPLMNEDIQKMLKDCDKSKSSILAITDMLEEIGDKNHMSLERWKFDDEWLWKKGDEGYDEVDCDE